MRGVLRVQIGIEQEDGHDRGIRFTELLALVALTRKLKGVRIVRNP